MGKKGDKLTNDATDMVESLLNKIQSLEGISSKKMFGGYGVFHDGKMFGIVSAKGEAFLKADESTIDNYISHGGKQHSKMPYYGIPEDIWNAEKLLISWVEESISLSK